MRRLISMLLVLVLLMVPCFADGDPNIEGGGGGTGSGSVSNGWNGGDDGVRVTIMQGAIPVSTLDYSNVQRETVQRSFKKQCKLYYKNGGELARRSDQYTNIIPTIPLPRIISSSGVNIIDEIRRYFVDEAVVRNLEKKAGLDEGELTDGSYKLMLEPISYFKYNNIRYAMTATEAALFDVQVGGDLKYWMGTLTHQNQPFAMFLEHADLGIQPWTGATSGKQANIDILNYLGVGIVSFRPEEDVELPPELVDPGNYTYHTNTDVITAALIRNGNNHDITPDDAKFTTFTILDRSYSVQYVAPAHSAQLVWVKWHTPKEPQEIDIYISGGETLHVTVGDVPDVEPPNPVFEDVNPGIRPDRLDLPDWGEQTRTTWSEWIPIWVPPMGLMPGYWTFEKADYVAALSVDYKLTPDERVQTEIKYSDGYEMKSGYGVNATCEVRVSGGDGVTDDDVTPVQNIVAVFPEFEYETYDRLLMTDKPGNYKASWMFKKNIYSYHDRPVHFVPLWYPDAAEYTVPLAVFDAWTPGGQLYTMVEDTIDIDGNVFQDWYIRITKTH